MPTINQLSQVDQLDEGDLLVIYSQNSGSARTVTVATLIEFLQQKVSQQTGLVTQYAAPSASGFNVQISPPTDGDSVLLILTAGAAYAAGTITLPALPIDGQEVLVTSQQSVASLSVVGGDAAVIGAPTSLGAGSSFRLRYDGVLKTHFRIG